MQISVNDTDEPAQPPADKKAAVAVAADSSEPSPRKILIIEDDQFISEMYIRGLQKAGYAVDSATTGTDGLAKATMGKYDLVLLDIFLPEKTGIDVLNELRNGQSSRIPGTKIVIMTNYAHDDESRAALESQADGYFIKADITPNKLVDLVHQIIG